MSENILVLAVHPDDETLGCGGTLLKHKAEGSCIHWLIATSVSTDMGYSEDTILQRSREIDAVSKHYDFDEVHQLNLPPTAIDTIPMSRLVTLFSAVIEKIRPNTLYLPYPHDVHSDHRIAFEAIFSCTKSFRYPSVKRIYVMETPSETDFAPPLAGNAFTPNCYVDISAHFDKKLKIAATYKSEMGVHPFPRSPETLTALAMYRGAAANCRFAEGFMLLKEIR